MYALKSVEQAATDRLLANGDVGAAGHLEPVHVRVWQGRQLPHCLQPSGGTTPDVSDDVERHIRPEACLSSPACL